jgi:hypothetical protein
MWALKLAIFVERNVMTRWGLVGPRKFDGCAATATPLKILKD